MMASQLCVLGEGAGGGGHPEAAGAVVDQGDEGVGEGARAGRRGRSPGRSRRRGRSRRGRRRRGRRRGGRRPSPRGRRCRRSRSCWRRRRGRPRRSGRPGRRPVGSRRRRRAPPSRASRASRSGPSPTIRGRALGQRRRTSAEGVGQVVDVLLGGEPADVGDDHVVGAEPEPSADGLAAGAVGAEQPGVDPAGPEDEVLGTPGLRGRGSSTARGRTSRSSGCGTSGGIARSAPATSRSGSGPSTGRSWCGSWRRPGCPRRARSRRTARPRVASVAMWTGRAGSGRWRGRADGRPAGGGGPRGRRGPGPTGEAGRRRPRGGWPVVGVDQLDLVARVAAGRGRAGARVRETPLTCGAVGLGDDRDPHRAASGGPSAPIGSAGDRPRRSLQSWHAQEPSPGYANRQSSRNHRVLARGAPP